MDTLLHVQKIENGIVIDHIPVGQGVSVLNKLVSFEELKKVIITIGLNCRSDKLGVKDFIKIYTNEIPQKIKDYISLTCSGASIKSIKNFEVEKKFTIEIPESVNDIIKCKNPNCITNNERHIHSKFICVNKKEVSFRCSYCERIFKLEELEIL